MWNFFFVWNFEFWVNWLVVQNVTFPSACVYVCAYGYSATLLHDFLKRKTTSSTLAMMTTTKNSKQLQIEQKFHRFGCKWTDCSDHWTCMKFMPWTFIAGCLDWTCVCYLLNNNRCIVNDLIATSIRMNVTQLKWIDKITFSLSVGSNERSGTGWNYRTQMLFLIRWTCVTVPFTLLSYFWIKRMKTVYEAKFLQLIFACDQRKTHNNRRWKKKHKAKQTKATKFK